MRGLGVALVVALLMACGSEDPGTSSETAAQPTRLNAAPEIYSLRLLPDEPSREDTAQVVIDARDPDRDELRMHIVWVRNGSPYRSGPSTTLPLTPLTPGDTLYAVVRVSDGQAEDVMESHPVTIRNLAPYVTSVTVRPEEVTAIESLLAVTHATDPEGDDVHYRYRWIRNRRDLEGYAVATLEPGLVRRGDEIQVAVVPIDQNGNEGDEVLSESVRVRNAPPLITSEPPSTLAGEALYEYQVEARDPDDDRPLRFEISKGPRGARIDIVTGRLSWEIPEDAVGHHDVEIRVRDPYGAESLQRYSIEVRLSAPPAAAR